MTGLRREQSSTRGEVLFAEQDDAGRSKLSPLADWTAADVWHYIALHEVPFNPLHDEFSPASAANPAPARWRWAKTPAPAAGGGRMK